MYTVLNTVIFTFSEKEQFFTGLFIVSVNYSSNTLAETLIIFEGMLSAHVDFYYFIHSFSSVFWKENRVTVFIRGKVLLFNMEGNAEMIQPIVSLSLSCRFRSSHPVVFLVKAVMEKIWSKFTGEHP